MPRLSPRQKYYILSNYRAITPQLWPLQITRPVSVKTSIPQKPVVAKPFLWGDKTLSKGGEGKGGGRIGFGRGGMIVISKQTVENKD